MTAEATNKVWAVESAEALAERIVAANEGGTPLEVVGGGSKRFYGRPVEAAATLSVAGLRGVVDYQPHELILVARPATPLVEIEALLAEQGQMLAFEPPHWGEGATLGGVIACNLAGPRRVKAGAARDHLLGFQAVTGRGEIVRGGGRVVKNVTGYDLSKLMCGSLGTLAVFSELCVKVLPRPETERTVLVAGMDEAEALRLLIAASRSSHEVSGLAYLPRGIPVPAPADGAAEGGASMLALRIEGPEPSVVYRSGRVVPEGTRAVSHLDGADSAAFWGAVRELEPVPAGPGEQLWRFSVPPTKGGDVAEALRRQGDVRLFFDWSGGVVWAVLPAGAAQDALLGLAREAGGHARLVRDPDGEGRKGVFSDLNPGQLRLNRSLKQSFDPNRVLNPGRLHPEV